MPPPDPKTTPPPIADYELLRKVGRGSYGDVWLARTATGLFRAVKIVWRDRFPDVGPYEREFKGLSDFMRLTRGEVRQLALLHVGRDDDQGFFYYVMELADDVVTGLQIDPSCYEPLTLKTLREAHTFLPAKQVIQYGIELAAGLDELHRAGLLHRDIKPSNIILVDGRPKLADIGLVSTEQEANTFVGTIGFVPPEGPGSHAADVYSLGKVLYEIATGNDRIDFPRLPTDLGKRVDREDYLELNEVIIKAAASKTADRYPDAASLHDELQLLVAGKSVRRLRFAEAGVARARKWILLAVVVALVAGAGALLERRRADVESAARRAAEAELADLSRRTLHDASLAAAQRALETGNYGVAREALERAIPEPGDPDLRGFEWHALYREAQGDPAEIIRESGDKVTRIEASADGRWVAIDQLSPRVEIYDQHTGEFIRSLDGIHRIAGFSPDGTRLVGTNSEYAIETWSIEDGSADPVPARKGVNRPLQVHPEMPYILFFEDGTGENDHQLGIWNYETGEDVVSWPIAKFKNETLQVFMSASGTRDLSTAILTLATNFSGKQENHLSIMDMRSGKIRVSENAPTLSPAAISPNGDIYVRRSDTMAIRAVNPERKTIAKLPYDSLTNRVVFNPSGENILFGASDNRVVVIEAATGETRRLFLGSSNQIDAFSYANGGQEIWSADRRGEIRRWDESTTKAAATLRSLDFSKGYRTKALRVNAGSDKIAVLDTGSQLHLLDLHTLDILWRKKGVSSLIRFTKGGLIVLDAEGRLIEFSAEDGNSKDTLGLLDLGQNITTARTSPDASRILVFSSSNEIILWDVSASQQIAHFSARRLDRDLGEFLSVQLTDEGLVVTTDVRGKLMLWDSKDGTIMKTVSVPEQPSTSYLSPRNDMIVLAGNYEDPMIRAIPSLEPVLTIKNGRRNGVDFAFHPREQKLATQFVRGSLNLVDVATGQRGPPLEFGTDSKESDLNALVSEITFSPDGNSLVTVDHIGNVRVWKR